MVALSVLGWALLAYALEKPIVAALLKPSGHQSFVYTSPIGGIDFLFRLSLYSGLIMSLPVLVYQGLKFMAPLLGGASRRFITTWVLASGALALGGLTFGYLIGLPAALHFLLHQFTNGQIKPLITIQSYMSFVMVYMVGAALMFQVPLLVIFINRIKPLKPSRLFRGERWVIVGAFVVSGLMNPSPVLLDQLMVAGPIILSYQLSIALVALINRPRWPGHVEALFERDRLIQASRLAIAGSSIVGLETSQPEPSRPRPFYFDSYP